MFLLLNFLWLHPHDHQRITLFCKFLIFSCNNTVNYFLINPSDKIYQFTLDQDVGWLPCASVLFLFRASTFFFKALLVFCIWKIISSSLKTCRGSNDSLAYIYIYTNNRKKKKYSYISGLLDFMGHKNLIRISNLESPGTFSAFIFSFSLLM